MFLTVLGGPGASASTRVPRPQERTLPTPHARGCCLPAKGASAAAKRESALPRGGSAHDAARPRRFFSRLGAVSSHRRRGARSPETGIQSAAIGRTDAVEGALASSRERNNLSRLLSDVAERREHVLITRNGRPAAVLVPIDEYEALEREPYAGHELRGRLRGLRSLRVGAYRIVHQLADADHTVCVAALRHRSATAPSPTETHDELSGQRAMRAQSRFAWTCARRRAAAAGLPAGRVSGDDARRALGSLMESDLAAPEAAHGSRPSEEAGDAAREQDR